MARSIKGLDQWRAAVAALPQDIRDAAAGALDKSTADAVKLLQRTVPHGETDALAKSITRTVDPSGLRVTISVGGPGAKYAPHVEFGHMDGGVHVPPQPFFFPAMRVSRKKVTGAIMRAVRKLIKDKQGANNVP